MHFLLQPRAAACVRTRVISVDLSLPGVLRTEGAGGEHASTTGESPTPEQGNRPGQG